MLITLNYDALLDSALDWVNGFVPSGRGRHAVFDPSAWYFANDRAARHLMRHLHGSVRFGLRPAGELSVSTPFDEPVLYGTGEEALSSYEGRSVSHRFVEGRPLVASTIVAGGSKGAKLAYNARPYAVYFSSAPRLLLEADSLLVMGYGWRDEHVNGWIQERLRQRPGLNSAVITKRTGNYTDKEHAAQERFLPALAGREPWVERGSFVYEPFEGDKTAETHSRLGDLYLVATGVPITDAVAAAVVAHLFER